jgi:hypothetical protein
MTATKDVTYEGEPWQQVLPSPTVVLSDGRDSTTPLFALTGVIQGPDGAALNGVTVTVSNLNTGQQATAVTGVTAGSGRYVVTLADFTSGIAAHRDDTFLIRVEASPMGFTDRNVKVKINRNHIQSAHATVNVCLEAKPDNTLLLQNYPNPFNPATWIPFQLAQEAPVTIHIYTATGQLIRTMALGHQKAGVYVTREKAAHWNGRNRFGDKVASGVYFYQLQAGDWSAVRRMLMVK